MNRDQNAGGRWTPAQRDALNRRLHAAEDLERAGQIARENGRYGLATTQDMQAVRAAEQAYDNATLVARTAVPA